MTKHQTEIEGVLDAVETSYFVTQLLAGCNGKIAVNAYNAAVDDFNAAVNRYYAISAANDDKGKQTLYQRKIAAEVTARSIIDSYKTASGTFELTIEDMPKPRKDKTKSDDEQLSIDFNAWRQCALDFDLQAASVNAVEKTALIGRLINAVNAVKAVKLITQSPSNAVKTEIAPFVIDYRKRQEKYRKQREAAKRRKNAPVEIGTAIEKYETVEPILITGNTADDAKLICALNEHLDNIEWYSFNMEVFKHEIFEGGDSDIRNQDRDTCSVCKEIRDTHENDYLELAKVYYRDNEANENVIDKALLEARACGTNAAVMIKREKGKKFYHFRKACLRTDKYTPNRTMKLRMA